MVTNFSGYVIPGSVLIAFALKWALDATADFPGDDYTLEARSSVRSSSSTKRRKEGGCRCSCRLKSWPMEGLAKLIISVMGAVIFYSSAYPQGELGAVLWATIYMFFALSGLVDVLVFYCPFVMPFELDKFTLALGFFMEGLSFWLDPGNRKSSMEAHAHSLLSLVIFGCSLSSLLEIVLQSRVLRFARSYFALIHGSWMIQTGFILYSQGPGVSPTTWAKNDDEYNGALLWITLTFTWHSVGSLVILLILMALSRKRSSHPLPIRARELPPIQSYGEELEAVQRSITSIPRCHFSSSLSNYPDMKP